jgi:N-acetylated-alpha-linked acidic dipeptidase
MKSFLFILLFAISIEAVAASDAQKQLETKFDALLSAESIRERMRETSSQPNHVGSPHDKKIAELIRDDFERFGWDAHVESTAVLYPTPKKLSLQLLKPEIYNATLFETPIVGDTTEHVKSGMLPPYLAYGGDGDVTAQLVYVNYGMPTDYEALERLGVSVKGKIVIARYGKGWRGIKPKLAYQHGAIGCIIYSDPADDGYAQDMAYPNGPSRPKDGVQRGSVLDLPVKPGDPGSSEASTVLRIPVLPISWGDAQHFLAALSGAVAPEGFRGALPITYRVGPGPAVARLVVESDWSKKPLFNVIAMIKGSVWPDEWVVRGNHHDAWVFGAWDPHSGHSSMMEEAKAIGALVKGGYKPKRTMVYASWDGEEPGLLGSSAWTSAHENELRARAVTYINSDANERGFFSAGASYFLAKFVNEVIDDVKDPETNISVKARKAAQLRVQALSPSANDDAKDAAKRVAQSGQIPVTDLGSGSDFSPFFQHLGIASMNVGFDGEAQSAGIYHSDYDTFEHFDKFGDPGFAYSVALAKVAGRMMLRLADADVLPFRFGELAFRVKSQMDQIKKAFAKQSERDDEINKLLDEGAFKLSSDPTSAFGTPTRKKASVLVNFDSMDKAILKLEAHAKNFDELAPKAVQPKNMEKINALLRSIEQTLLDPEGLPARPWYRHLLLAPGLTTGYAAKTLPGIREALEDYRFEDADTYTKRTAAALSAVADQLDDAARLLQNQ